MKANMLNLTMFEKTGPETLALKSLTGRDDVSINEIFSSSTHPNKKNYKHMLITPKPVSIVHASDITFSIIQSTQKVYEVQCIS